MDDSDDSAAIQAKNTPRGAQRAASCLLGVFAVALGPSSASAQSVYVASSVTNTVTPIDVSTMAVKGNPVPLGAQPVALVVTPDGKTVLAAILAKKFSTALTVIDATRNALEPSGRMGKTLHDLALRKSLGTFGPPAALVLEPHPRSEGRLLAHTLVKNGNFGPGVSQFNLKRVVWIHFIRGKPDGNYAELMAVTPDNARFYVPGTDRKSGQAFLSEFNFFFMSGQSHTGLRKDIRLAGGAVGALGITPDSRLVIVASQDATGGIVNTVDRADNDRVQSFGLGSGVIPRDLAIGRNAGGIFGLLTTNQVLVRLSASGIPAAATASATLFPGNFIPDKVELTPDGTVAYMTDGAQPFVARMDVSTGFGAVRMVRLPSTSPPAALAISPDGKFVFVAQKDSTGGTVSRIDVGTNEVKSVAVQGEPVALAVGPVAPGGTGSGTPTCPGTAQLCGGKCVAVDIDAANCGACGRACPAGDICISGRCECPPGRQICGAACLDVTTDRGNCGRCGRPCIPGDVCVSGQCVCPVGLNVCSSQCVNEDTDRRNCGRCGNVCAADEVCSSGRCTCAPSHEVCNGVCTETQNSVANCGRCGHACIPGDICVSGNCVCPAGRNVCSGQCVNLDVNLRNCGTCGRVCLPGDSCVSGRCVCPDPNKVCRNACVDVETDPSNCGTCGRACAAGQKCVGGRCG